MRTLLLSAALAMALPGLAFAQNVQTPQEKGLSAPVVALMPVVMANIDTLGLDEDQKAALADWMATAPAARGALEDETAALRAQMAELILSDAPQDQREALATRIGDNETALILMRSRCVDNLRSLLTAEQFAQTVAMAAAN